MMKTVAVESLAGGWQDAIAAALAASTRAFAPYSGFEVGAALVTAGGEIIVGANYESASYGLTLCAERTALATAQVQGRVTEIRILAVVARRADGQVLAQPVVPCGACRQWIAEAVARCGCDWTILCADSAARRVWVTSSHELLPASFAL
jgi:cytidine deaminase